MIVLNQPVGTAELSAWQIGPDLTWVQTRLTLHARRLNQRRDGRLVVRGVAGGYLRTFEFNHRLSWAKRLIKRYTFSEMATGEPITGLNRPQTHL